MKNLLRLLLAGCIIIMAAACNSNSHDKETVTLTIESKLVAKGETAASATIYYNATNEATHKNFLIPVGDIYGFDYIEGYRYRIVADRYKEAIDGVATGKDFYILVRVISQTKDNGSDTEIKPEQ